jgi:hypothetical protein
MEDALSSTEITNIYFNQFMIAVSNHDVAIVLRRNGKNEAVLNLSHATAKALAGSLDEAIGDFELQTELKTVEDDLEHSEE